jgi:hypothetical protein
MGNHFILTPYFIDTPVPGLERLAEPDWQVNKVMMAGGRPLERMLSLYKPLIQTVAHQLRQGNRPVSIAGDCCTAIAVLGGL